MAKEAAAAAMDKNVNDDGVRNPAAKASEAMEKAMSDQQVRASRSLGAPMRAPAA